MRKSHGEFVSVIISIMLVTLSAVASPAPKSNPIPISEQVMAKATTFLGDSGITMLCATLVGAGVGILLDAPYIGAGVGSYIGYKIADERATNAKIHGVRSHYRSALPEKEIYDLNDHLGYLNSRKAEGALEELQSTFDQELDTMIYHTATAKPQEDGTIPVVDPTAKGLVIYLPGAGTDRSSGRTFALPAATFTKLGFSGLSFDYPYHLHGPNQRSMPIPYKEFLPWVQRIIQKYRQPGQPVYIVGHSFGANVAAELAYRVPNLEIAGILAIAPVAPSSDSEEYINYYLADRMEEIGMVSVHPPGSWFAGNTIQSFSLWGLYDNRKEKHVSSSKVPLHIAVGMKDPFVRPDSFLDVDYRSKRKDLARRNTGKIHFDTKVMNEPRIGETKSDYAWFKRLIPAAQLWFHKGIGHTFNDVDLEQDRQKQDLLSAHFLNLFQSHSPSEAEDEPFDLSIAQQIWKSVQKEEAAFLLRCKKWVTGRINDVEWKARSFGKARLERDEREFYERSSDALMEKALNGEYSQTEYPYNRRIRLPTYRSIINKRPDSFEEVLHWWKSTSSSDRDRARAYFGEPLFSIAKTSKLAIRLKNEAGNRQVQSPQLALKKWATDPTFRSWIDMGVGYSKIVEIYNSNNKAEANALLGQYRGYLKAAQKVIMDAIIETKTSVPRFYLKHAEQIQKMKNRGQVDQALFEAYRLHLASSFSERGGSLRF
ncbi:MAG: alpha/beta fold hydrolase [Bdellovibrionales bacterium]|nr:alpha/beta fold hydrolase [Bdellovibrionales bacterium]